MAVMGNVSRPLIGLLVATVLFFSLWIVALKPSGSTGSGVGRYQSAINAARASAAEQDRAAAAAGNTVVPATKPAAAAVALTGQHSRFRAGTHTRVLTGAASTASLSGRYSAGSPEAVDRALAAHKVLVLLFYNPAASDDQAVKQELTDVLVRPSRILKLAVPLSEIASYPAVTSQVLIGTSPTLVIVNGLGRAQTITGFSDLWPIVERVSAALQAVPGSRRTSR